MMLAGFTSVFKQIGSPMGSISASSGPEKGASGNTGLGGSWRGRQRPLAPLPGRWHTRIATQVWLCRGRVRPARSWWAALY